MANRLTLFRPTVSQRWLSSSTTTTTAAATATATAAVSKEKKNPSLYYKLSRLKTRPDSESDSSVTQILNEMVNTGKFINRFDIIDQVNLFRKRKNYQIALQLSEWMESRKIKMNNADRAIRIDLLSKTKGIATAEQYFESLQKSAKTKKTYGALLSSYCKEKNLDKAQELFSKIKDLNFVSTLNYNNLISLYLATNQFEKVALLAREMEENGIKADLYTYNLLMNSYASLEDLNAVEGVLDNMKTNKLECDWFTYGNLATIYCNAGRHDKAKAFLEKLEKLENLKEREAFHMLINLYRQMSDLSGVNCAWKSLKSVFPIPCNTSYLLVLSAFSDLGDLESLEKCFREWESGCSLYDVRLCNVVLESYLKRDMIDDANTLYESMVRKGGQPNLKTLDLLTNYHIKNHHIDIALMYLEIGECKAVAEKLDLFPVDDTIKLFLKYFEENNDPINAEKFCSSMKKMERLDPSVYDSLLSSKNIFH